MEGNNEVKSPTEPIQNESVSNGKDTSASTSKSNKTDKKTVENNNQSVNCYW